MYPLRLFFLFLSGKSNSAAVTGIEITELQFWFYAEQVPCWNDRKLNETVRTDFQRKPTIQNFIEILR
jgi:hypothetical protein